MRWISVKKARTLPKSLLRRKQWQSSQRGLRLELVAVQGQAILATESGVAVVRRKAISGARKSDFSSRK